MCNNAILWLCTSIAGGAHLHFAVASVDDVQNAIHSQRRLCNVGGHDALARTLRRLVKNLGLQVGGQLGVDGQDEQGRHLFPQMINPLLQYNASKLQDIFMPHKDTTISKQCASYCCKNSWVSRIAGSFRANTCKAKHVASISSWPVMKMRMSPSG